jgi:cell division protein FtsB
MDQFLRDLRRRASVFLWPSLSACVLAYFFYHLIQGDRGILAWQKLEAQLALQEKELAHLEDSHERLDKKVQLLRSHVCPDLLDEQAKTILGYAHPNDRIILKEDLN